MAKHGTATRYVKGKCRCERCRTAYSEYRRERRKRLRSKPLPDDLRHGTSNAYRDYGCRCQECKAEAIRHNYKWGAKQPHGFYGKYKLGGCRCEECRAAHRENIKELKRKRASLPIPDTVKHGTNATYNNWACRCLECSKAHAVVCAKNYQKRKRRMKK